MENKKPSRGIIVYVIFSVIGLAIAVTGMWDKIFETIVKIGVTDKSMLAILNDMFDRLYRPSEVIVLSRWIGKLIGGLIGLLITIAILRLKEWARKVNIILIAFTLLFLVLSIPKHFPYYVAMFKMKLWLGYYLFGLLLLIPLIASPVFLYFFTRPKVKEQFK